MPGLFGEARDRGEIREVEREEPDIRTGDRRPNAAERGRGLRGIAGRQDHAYPARREPERRLESEAARGTGDDGPASVESRGALERPILEVHVSICRYDRQVGRGSLKTSGPETRKARVAECAAGLSIRPLRDQRVHSDLQP